MTLALSATDAFLRYTPLLGLLLAIPGTYLVVQAWASESKRINWLGAVLLGLGILADLVVFLLQNFILIQL